MKRTMKKMVALITMLVVLLTATPVSAAYDSTDRTWVADKIVTYLPINNKVGSFSLADSRTKKKITVKSSNPKLGKIVYKNYSFFSTAEFIPKRTGSAVLTTKVGTKTFKTKVTILKYTNPISSIKLGKKNDNIKISGSKFAKTDRIYLSYDKYAGKTIDVKPYVKKGWYIGLIQIVDKKGNSLQGTIQDPDGTCMDLKVKGGKGNCMITISLFNGKNNAEIRYCIVFK